LFTENYLKNYYFNKDFYNFEEVLLNFRDIKKENNKIDDVYEWVFEFKNILLGMLALKENPKLGFKDTNQYEKYFIYVKEVSEEILNESPDKSTIDYFFIFWLYQLLEPESPAIKINGYEILFNLFKKYFMLDKTKFLVFDKNNQLKNYLINWIVFGLVKDYLSNKNNILYLKEKLNKEVSIEGFDNKDKDNKDNKDKDNKDKDNNKSYLRFLFYCLIFAVLLFVAIYGIVIGFPVMIKIIQKIFSSNIVK
jgi:hypothetical protein